MPHPFPFLYPLPLPSGLDAPHLALPVPPSYVCLPVCLFMSPPSPVPFNLPRLSFLTPLSSLFTNHWTLSLVQRGKRVGVRGTVEG